MEKTKIAIIDLGSNSVRMIIMKIYKNGSYKMVDQAKEMVRLSENMGQEMTLKPEPIKRTLYALHLFRQLIEAHRVDKIFPVATAAVRNAANQQEFLYRVKTETGFDFQVISGEEEAYYAYLGVINTVQLEDGLIIDIGGASTELVWVKNREIKEAVSLPYGAVVLSERFLNSEGDPPEQAKKMEKFMLGELKKVKWLKNTKGLSIVGLGGSIRTLAKIDRKKIGFPLESLHNYQMTIDEVIQAYDTLIRVGVEERKKIPGVARERADIIVGGLAPVKVIMDYLKADKLIISGNGLREGVFYKHYLKEFGYGDPRIGDILYHSVENVLNNYEANLKHSIHVQRLALSIFDQTKGLHKMGEEERKLLSVSALMHDIGMYVDYYNHHKHGFYLVLNSKINALRNRELVMCAFVVGMHRNLELKKDWKIFHMLMNKEDYQTAKKLGLFLRLGEMLDRNEYGSVQDVICHGTGKQIQIIVKARHAVELEIAAAMKSKKDFEKLFKKKLNIYRENSRQDQ